MAELRLNALLFLVVHQKDRRSRERLEARSVIAVPLVQLSVQIA